MSTQSSEKLDALGLVASIFARPQQGLDARTRRVTDDQYRYLMDLIRQGGGSVSASTARRGVWAAPDGNRYELAFEPLAYRYTIRQLEGYVPDGPGLFG